MRFITLFSVVIALLLISPLAAEPWQRHTIDNSSRGADGVRLADANHDGLLDIATGWEEGGVIRVYLNPGPTAAQEPWPAVTVGQVKSPEDALLTDLDGDGNTDVVSCCEGGTRSVYVHWAPSDPQQYLESAAWETQAIPALQKQQHWMYALPLQIDRRHGTDLVIGSKGKATVGWLQAPADARKLADWKWHPLYQAGWIMSLESHDLDDDGDSDIVVSDRKGKNAGLLWLEHPGEQAAAAGEPWKEHRIGADGLEVLFLAVGQVGGDQRADIVVSTRNGKVLTFIREDDTWREQAFDNPFGAPNGKSVAIGDLDGDRQPDLVHAINSGGNRQHPGVTWASSPWSQQNQPIQWQDLSGERGVKFDLLQLLDLDADGDLDVLTCEERDNLGVFWYENPRRNTKSQ